MVRTEIATSLIRRSIDFIALASSDGHLQYVNPAGRSLTGWGPEPPEGAGFGTFAQLFMPDDLAFAQEVILAEFARTGRWTGYFRLRDRAAGAAVDVHLSLFGISGNGMAIVARDVTGQHRSDARLRLLVDVGAVLAQSLDYLATLESLADLIVKTGLAAYCTIDVFNAPQNGRTAIERVCAKHSDPARHDLLQELNRFTPQFEGHHHPIGIVLADGSSTLVPAIDDGWIERAAVSPEHAAVLRALAPRSLVVVPLVAAGDVVGALSCILTAGATRAYAAEDLFFIEELGRRAGAAFNNSQLYARERRIAAALQAASLPQTLPTLAGVRLDAEYRSGSSEATIGGDWYDAFMLDDGRLALTVGDVSGHGLKAAIAMTKLRQAMQSAALIDPQPATMLDAAERTLRVHAGNEYATALAAVFDARERTLTFASAGHPWPIVRSPAGATGEFGNGGLLLGTGTPAAYDTRTLPLEPGSLVCFFTDGLTEATRDLAQGYGRLHRALGRAGPIAAKDVVDAVLRGEEPRDDVAVLILEICGAAPRATASRA